MTREALRGCSMAEARAEHVLQVTVTGPHIEVVVSHYCGDHPWHIKPDRLTDFEISIRRFVDSL